MAVEFLVQWVWQAVSLFAGTFVHEDVAIFAGAYLVAARNFPAALAFASLLSGVIVGDLAIYGLGMLARKWSRMHWLASRINADRLQTWLDRRLLIAVAFGRVMPTLAFPTFAACGWLGIPFKRFALASIATSVVYVSVTFFGLLIFGRCLPAWASTYGWIAAAAAILAIWIVRRVLSRRQAKLILSRGAATDIPDAETLSLHEGMPPLPPSKVRVAPSEKIWTLPYYAPVFVQWFWLSLRYRGLTLPTVANPLIEAGGLIGESKSECMAMPTAAATPYMARTIAIDCREGNDLEQNTLQARLALSSAGLDFPVILKPDIGWRGFGVRRVNDRAELKAYLAEFPEGQRLILQEYVPFHGEAGVFYVRRPGRARGEIFSLTLRYYPFVVGDGRSTIRDLILANPRTRWKRKVLLAQNAERLDDVPDAGEGVRLAIVGSNRVGGLYVNGARHITPELTARIEEIAQSIPEFHFGRFDIRFRSIEELEAGEGFSIIEINGAGAEAIHIWDPDYPILAGYRVLFEQQRLMFQIGAANRARGFRPLKPLDLIRCQQRQQKLLPIYPSSG